MTLNELTCNRGSSERVNKMYGHRQGDLSVRRGARDGIQGSDLWTPAASLSRLTDFSIELCFASAVLLVFFLSLNTDHRMWGKRPDASHRRVCSLNINS